MPEGYSNNDFFEKREEIAYVMSQKVNEKLTEVFAECISLIITNVELEDSFEN